MTQEEKKNILLRDLCARLPYGVIMTNIELPETYYPLTCGDLHDAMFDDNWNDVPYLRPMSSMTEEEKLEFSLVSIYAFVHYNEIAKMDWLNKHHFDYRDLISRGLAVEVTKENNPYKD